MNPADCYCAALEGDVGVAGGLQLTEPASEHVVLKDSGNVFVTLLFIMNN